MADAEAIKLAVPRLLFGGLQGLHQVGGRLVAHPIQAGEQGRIQAVEIRQRAHQAAVHQLFDQLAAEPIHIQGALAHPVPQATPQDRRAAAVHAAGGGFIALPHQVGATFGAVLGQLHRGGVAGPELRQHPHHFGNDLPGFAHHDGVAQVQIQFCDPIGVVEGGAADAGAGQGDCFEFGHGGDGTGAAHLSTNAEQTGGGFFGWVFEGDGPARGLLGEAGFVLQLQVVQLHHHAVGGIGEVMTPLLPVVAEALDGGQVFAALPVRVHAETGSVQPLQSCPLAGGLGVTRQVQGVGEKVEPAGGHHLRIQLAQGSGAGVAGIGEQRFTPLLPFGIDRREGGIRDEGFSSHFHPFRWVLDLQPQRNRADRAHVGGDLFTAAAIAPGGGPLQHPIAVAQGQGVAVNFQFPHQGQAGVAGTVQHLEQPLVPGLQVVAVEGVVEAEHAHAVLNAGEPLRRSSAHPLGGAVGPLQARIVLF